MVRNSSLGEPALDRLGSSTRRSEESFGRFTREVFAIVVMVRIGDFVDGALK
ncbi:hypothetical protein SNK04_003795 [Fusarium graminearum]